jgi:cell division protease FtsH
MVTRFGMSDKLGLRTFGNTNQQVFLGREIGEQRDYSEHYAEEIDNEVKRILSGAYNRAKSLLLEHRDKLEELAGALLERETLDRSEFEDIMSGTLTAPAMFNANID